MIEVDVKQRTPEWLKLRLGKITGTRLKEVFKKDDLPLIDTMIAEIDDFNIKENKKDLIEKRLKKIRNDKSTLSTSIENSLKNFQTARESLRWSSRSWQSEPMR